MDEDDWAPPCGVSRLPAAAWRKAEDDRRFLEALHFFTVENVRWRALPEASVLGTACGSASSAEQGGCLRGLFRHARLDEFHGASPSDVRLNHRARACVGSRSKRGQEGQALGRSRGGFTTKIHAKSDASGDIIAFDLTGGEAFDGRHFETLLDIGPDIQPRAVICDKGYASKANRDAARARGIVPSSPTRLTKRTSRPSSPDPIQGPRPHRAGRRTIPSGQREDPSMGGWYNKHSVFLQYAARVFQGWRLAQGRLPPRRPGPLP